MGSILVMGLQQANTNPGPWWSGVVLVAVVMASALIISSFAETAYQRLTR